MIGKENIESGLSMPCCLDFMGGLKSLGRAGLNSKALETGGSWILTRKARNGEDIKRLDEEAIFLFKNTYLWESKDI